MSNCSWGWSMMMGWTDSVWQMCLQHNNRAAAGAATATDVLWSAFWQQTELLLMRPSRFKTKTMRLQLGDESYSAPSVHQTQQVRIVKGCCHHYKLETKHLSSRVRDALVYQSCSFFLTLFKRGVGSNPCSKRTAKFVIICLILSAKCLKGGEGEGGVKGVLNNVKKNCKIDKEGHP